MGVFDLPAPFFSWIDSLIGSVTSPAVRLVFWGVITALLSMGLYWLVSPQARLATVKAKAVAARRALNSHDGEFNEAWPLMRSMLGLSFRQLGMSTWPALVASLPALALIVWLSNAYGYDMPRNDGVAVEARALPESAATAELARDEAAGGAGHRIVVRDPAGEVVNEIPLSAPVPIIHKHQWWNALIGNPLGYLPDDGVVEAVEIDLPEKEYLAFGPEWIRPWYVTFFATLIIASLAIKIAGRIE